MCSNCCDRSDCWRIFLALFSVLLFPSSAKWRYELSTNWIQLARVSLLQIVIPLCLAVISFQSRCVWHLSELAIVSLFIAVFRGVPHDDDEKHHLTPTSTTSGNHLQEFISSQNQGNWGIFQHKLLWQRCRRIWRMSVIISWGFQNLVGQFAAEPWFTVEIPDDSPRRPFCRVLDQWRDPPRGCQCAEHATDKY